MSIKIKDVMSERVVSARPHHTVEHVRNLMIRNDIQAVPVVGVDDEALGIVTSSDLVPQLKDGSPISQHMTTEVVTLPAYNDVQIAARVMRKNKIHHVLVTHEKAVIGIVSSFDLLQIVEEHRFVRKDKVVAGGARA